MPLAETPNVIPALPELFLALIVMVSVVLGVFQKGGANEINVKVFRVVFWLSTISITLTAFLLILYAGERTVTFAGLFLSDTYSVFCKILILTGSVITLVIARQFLERHEMARFEYPIIITIATLGMLMMVSANDLISLYLSLELQSLSLYIIAAIRRDDIRSSESGLKYFVLGALASGLFLYGASLIYGFSGTTNFDELSKIFSASTDAKIGLGIIFGITFIIAGLAFKIAAVPFHMWTPDVYEGAPTPVTAFFAVAPKIAALALLIRVMVGPFGDLWAHWQQIIVFLSIASMLLGAFGAIKQYNIKRLMAYSSIGHIGYALIGLANGNEAGVRAVLIYLAIYLVMNIGCFACILAMRKDDRMVENIESLAGLGKSHPLLAAAMAIFMFSMAGIPPMAGFFGKLYIFLAAIENELYLLAIIGVLTSVVASFYYLRIIRIIYFDDIDEPLDKPIDKEIGIVTTFAGLAVLFFFLYPGYLVTKAATAAASLFSG